MSAKMHCESQVQVAERSSQWNKSEFICELNNKARQMMPDAFQRKQESTYYGSVEASDYGLIYSQKC